MSYMRYKRNKYIIHFIIYTILVMFFLTFLCFTFKEDEEVTMAFMGHSMRNLININTLDVHPPLYYLLLKIFLVITTFWTKSIFIKTIFARIFSFLIYLLTFFFLIKIISISGLRINYKVQFIIYCFMPSILEVATHLRMYELATLFIVIEYYALINYKNNNNNIYLVISIIFALLAAYTQYFVAIIAGVLFIVFIIEFTLIKSYIKCYKIIISAVIFNVLYLPIYPYVIKQFINRSKFPSGGTGIIDQTVSSLVQLTASGNVVKELFDVILICLLSLLSIYIIKIFKNKKIYIRLIEILLSIFISIILELLISIIYSPFFECRFIFPLVSIYFFLLLSALIYYLHNNLSYKRIYFYVILFLISIMVGASDLSKFNQNIKQYDIPSITLIRNFNKWRKTNNKNIIVNTNCYPTKFNESLYATQNSVYLKSIKKNAIIYNPNNTNIYSECNGNVKFVHKLFNNLYMK